MRTKMPELQFGCSIFTSHFSTKSPNGLSYTST